MRGRDSMTWPSAGERRSAALRERPRRRQPRTDRADRAVKLHEVTRGQFARLMGFDPSQFIATFSRLQEAFEKDLQIPVCLHPLERLRSNLVCGVQSSLLKDNAR